MNINGFKSLVCCGEENVEDTHEMELFKEDPSYELRSLDDSNHWKTEPIAGDSTGKEADPHDAHFEFGGEASAWLAVEPNIFVTPCTSRSDDDMACDESVHLSSSSDITSGESSQRHSETIINASTAEAEISAMLQSPTDPIGKFLRQRGISAKQAVAFKIHSLLISAPKTVRQRYGPRHEQSAEERAQLCKDRNRAHAKATRQRKKIFEQVDSIIEAQRAGGSGKRGGKGMRERSRRALKSSVPSDEGYWNADDNEDEDDEEDGMSLC